MTLSNAEFKRAIGFGVGAVVGTAVAFIVNPGGSKTSFANRFAWNTATIATYSAVCTALSSMDYQWPVIFGGAVLVAAIRE